MNKLIGILKFIDLKNLNTSILNKTLYALSRYILVTI